MKCKKFVSRIQAYHDGELAAGEAEKLEEHLKSCPACSGELERLRSLSALVRGLEAPEVRPSAWNTYSADVLRKARSVAGKKAPAPERARIFPFIRPRLAYAAAAILLVFAAGMVYRFSVAHRQSVGDAAYFEISQRPIVERFEAGDPGYSVMSFSPENNPVAVVWIFGYRIENNHEENGGTYL